MGTPLPRIWIVTNPEHVDGPVAPVARALQDCPAGAVGVQLRASEATDRELVEWGHMLRFATHRSGSPLTLSGRADIAEIVGADGVHLPESGVSPNVVRSEWPDLALVGTSRHDREGLRRAAHEGASFAFLSPVFPVPGKGEPIGVASFAAQIAGVGIPTYALGGIGVAQVARLAATGAQGIAVRRAIYDAPDPNAALRDLLRELDKTGLNGE